MSSWKTYGGIHNAENSGKISAQSLSVKRLIVQEPYIGIFDICGGLNVTGNIYSEYLNVNRSASFGLTAEDNISVLSTTDFFSPVIFHGNSTTTGNIVSLRSFVAENSVFIGDAIHFGNVISTVQSIYYDNSGIGINNPTPNAALDISTNQPYSISVKSSSQSNESIIAQNCSGQAITIGVDFSSAHIKFYHDISLNSGKETHAYINYFSDGTLNIDVSQNVNISGQMTVSPDYITNKHINGESLAVYDISSGAYYHDIYGSSVSNTGNALTLVATDLSSNTFMNIVTPLNEGLTVGGGAYAGDATRPVGIIGLTNSENPSQVIVGGNSVVKYFSTTGVNTFKPRIDQYVLDVNGPIHVDNGDVTSVATTPFQIYQMSIPQNNKNFGIAMGSSVDLSENVVPYFREKIIRTSDYGQTWKTIDISNSVLLSNCDSLTGVQLIDNSNCFITGNASLLFSNDLGSNWKGISITPYPFGSDSFVYNHIYINPFPTINGNVYGYFAVDASSTMVGFEYSLSNNTGKTATSMKVDANRYINKIQYIQANSNTIYLAGNAIVKYNATVGSVPTYVSSHVYRNYSYSQIKIFDNSYAIAIGNNVISSTINGGQSWTDISFNRAANGGVNFRSVHLIDSSNAIAVGWYGNIWISSNQGSSWSRMPNNTINASGKSGLLTTNTMFDDVFMVDMNTILLVNTIQEYSRSGNVYGESNIFNVFAPNYLNRSANIVMDVSGTVNVSGDLRISDGGSFISTNSSMNMFNNTVQNIQFGGDATQIIIGNATLGNTTIRTNVIMNQNLSMTSGNSVLSISGRMNLSGNAQIGGNTHIGGNVTIGKTLIVSGNTTLNSSAIVNGESFFNRNLNINNADVLLNTGSIRVDNVFPSNSEIRVGGPDNTIYIGGTANENKRQEIFIGQTSLDGGSIDNYSTIYIGGKNDSVVIQGNATFLNVLQPAVEAPTTIVNVPIIGTGANVTSGGAGIDIFDNSYAPLNVGAYIKNSYAYMHVGSDMQSFVFKAPSYGAIDPATGLPMANTYEDIYRISPDNRVRLGVNQLTLKGTNVKRGLVVLQSDSDFKSYQSVIGNSFNPSPLNPDADYAINICGDFDISNILLKNADTVYGSQTIGSNLVIGNLSSPSSLSIYGNTNTYGDLITYGNAIFKQLVLPTGNIGIGVFSPQYPLDISGIARILGPLVATNYDGARFSSNYGSVWSNTSNTASTGSYYQDVAMSYDGKYQFGLLYNKTGFGSLNVSSNYGSSWSSVNLPSSYTDNIIYQAVPYLSSNTQTFQFAALNAATWLPNAQPLNVQVGTYVATSSSNTNAWNVFDSSTTTAWQSATSSYNASGVYTGTYDTNSIPGEWVQIQLPYSFILNKYKIYNNLTSYGFPSNVPGPKNLYVFGSNNNSWTLINNTLLDGSEQVVSFNNSISYSSYRFVVNSIGIGGANSFALIAKVDLIGIVQNSTGAFSYSMAASGNGQNILIANQSYIPSNGNLYISTNYGQSFNDIGQKVSNGVWQGVAVSQSGMYQAAIGINPSGSSNIWISTNSGVTWGQRIGVSNGWQSIAMNATGQYITAIQAGNVSIPAGNIWVSSTYGSSWSSYGNIYQYSTSVNAFANQGSSDFNRTIRISADGKYQTALGLGLSTDRNKGNANIWTNSNYGQGSWTDSGVSTPVINGNVSILSSVSMIGSGKDQIVSYIANVVGGNSVSGSFMKSSNYGETWTMGEFSTPVESANGNLYRGFFPKIETSMNGQYILSATKYQDISGSMYNNTNSTATGIGNIFASSVIVTNTMLESLYMGSSHSGNVNSNHGCKIYVPHANDSAIVMGCDIAWNSTYINSISQSSQNPLCLNSAGGVVGIGKINPGEYSLDVSGNMNLDGSLNINGYSNFSSAVAFTSAIVNSNSPNSNTIQLSDSTNIGNKMNLIGALTSSTVNPIAITNDVGIVYGVNKGNVSGGLLLAPFKANGSGMRISTTGNVGIGTANMADSSYVFPLQIQGASGTLLKLINNTSGYTQGQSNIEFWDNSANYNLAKISAIDLVNGPSIPRSAMAFSVGYNSNFVEGLCIVGNVNANNGTTAFIGVGTTVPAYALDISGGDMRVAGSTVGGTIRFGSPQSAVIQSGTSHMTILNNNSGNLFLGTNNGNVAAITNLGVNISSTTLSSNSTTGALVVSGGAGIGGNVVIAGSINVNATTPSIIGGVTLNTANLSGVVTCGNIIATNTSSTINGIGISNGSITGPTTFTVNGVSIFNQTMSSIKGITTLTNIRSSIGGVNFINGLIDAAAGVGISYIGAATFNTSGSSAAISNISTLELGGTITSTSTSNTINNVGINAGTITASTTNTINGIIINSGVITASTTNTINGININSGVINATRLGIATTASATYPVDINGTARVSQLYISQSSISTNGADLFLNTGSANTIHFRPNGSGSSTNQGTYTAAGQMTAVTFNASSDYRIKSNVQPIPDEYTIDNLRPVHYDMSGGQGHDMGFIAHEVQDIFPFLVSGVKDGENFQSMNYNGFIALLVKELQDVKKENNILKDRLNKIEERLGV